FTARWRRAEQGKAAMFSRVGGALETEQRAQEGAVKKGAAAQVHVQCGGSTGQAFLGVLAKGQALLHGRPAFHQKRYRALVLAYANDALRCWHGQPPFKRIEGERQNWEWRTLFGRR